MNPKRKSAFWSDVADLAALRRLIPAERREGSLVRQWFDEQRCATAKGKQ